MKINSKILLVVNPISGSISKEEIIASIKNEIAFRKYTLTIFKTSGKKDIANLQKKIAEDQPDRILILGGDGTIKLVSEVMGAASIPIGLLPAGSANGMAVTLGIMGTLQENLEIALSDTLLHIDKIKINNQICTHIADFGINAELIKNYELSGVRGNLGYFLQTIPTLLSCDYPFQFEITLNGKTLRKIGVLLAIANAQKYGTGATINPKGKMDDGLFEVIIFKSLDLIEITKTLRERVVLHQDFAESFTTSNVTIRCKEAVPFQIDGEYQQKVTKVHAVMSDEKLIVAVPSNDRIKPLH